MSKLILRFLILFFLLTNNTIAKENIMILKLKDGDVKIELFEDVAPKHVERIKELANSGKYDNVVFHRVIDGFMAQTGDVKFGNSSNDDFDLRRAGTGGSDMEDLKSEFSELPHESKMATILDFNRLDKDSPAINVICSKVEKMYTYRYNLNID